jgi:hypothetical protein
LLGSEVLSRICKMLALIGYMFEVGPQPQPSSNNQTVNQTTASGFFWLIDKCQSACLFVWQIFQSISQIIFYLFDCWQACGQSIKHIIDNIIEGCTGLKTFIMRDCEISNFPDVITKLAEKHGSTLQTSFHCGKVQNLTHTKDEMFGRAHFRHLYGIKTLTLAIVLDEGEHDMTRSIQDFLKPYSRTLEVLIVQAEDGSAFEQHQVRYIDKASARLLSSPSDEGDSLVETNFCPPLKHIYLSPIIEAASTLDEDDNEQKTLLLPETIKQARLRSIEVHTERDAGKTFMQSVFGDIFKV